MTIRTASIKGFALAATLACTASFALDATAADLEVRIDGLRSAEGDVRVALHRQVGEGSFPGDAGVVGASFRRAAEGAVRFIFADVAPGAYAVAAFHDADGDGALNQNIVGMPTEGHGFSNGARGFMGPPSFEDAAVTVGKSEAVVSITVSIDYPMGAQQ
ncbi:MAG: DUF2141 domain-containing protein [Rhodospirillales bacterium]|nr:DUF2141 domain-containing protein [Rhodospirillales bacterium]